MRAPKREASSSALKESLPKKSARPRHDAKSSMAKSSTATKKDAVEVEEKPNFSGDGPFPSWRRPSPAECFAARDALALLHGEPGAIPLSPSPSSSPSPSAPSHKTFSDPNGCHNDCLSVLDSLVRTILSQNTTDATSVRAFRSLKSVLPTWEQVRTAPVGVLEEAIRVGGLAEIKAARIRAILETIRAEALEKKRGGKGKGKREGGAEEEEEKDKSKREANGGGNDGGGSLLSLEYLREWPDAERIKEELVRFNGVGPKTAGEFLLFSLCFKGNAQKQKKRASGFFFTPLFSLTSFLPFFFRQQRRQRRRRRQQQQQQQPASFSSRFD